MAIYRQGRDSLDKEIGPAHLQTPSVKYPSNSEVFVSDEFKPLSIAHGINPKSVIAHIRVLATLKMCVVFIAAGLVAGSAIVFTLESKNISLAQILARAPIIDVLMPHPKTSSGAPEGGRVAKGNQLGTAANNSSKNDASAIQSQSENDTGSGNNTGGGSQGSDYGTPPKFNSATTQIDLAKVTSALYHNATGFTENVSNIPTSNHLVTDLQPNFIRTDQPALFSGNTYQNLKVVFPRIQFIIGGTFQYDQKFCPPPTHYLNCTYPGDANDWTAWSNYVTSYVNQAKAVGYAGEWDIWSEPDNPPGTYGSGFIAVRSQTQYLEAFQKAYSIIRATFPSAGIDGPSFAQFSNSSPNLMEAFLTYTLKTNHDSLLRLSWHSNGVAPTTLAQDMSFIRNWLKTSGLPSIWIDIQEYQGAHYYSPGGLVNFIQSLEVNAALGAGHACWNPQPNFSDCSAGDLDGSIAQDGQPTPLWWVYDSYAQMNGSKVTTQEITNDALASLASYNATTHTLYLLVGQPSDANVSPGIVVNNVPNLPKATVTGEYFPNLSLQSGSTITNPSLENPEDKYQQTITLSGRSLSIGMPTIKPWSAYFLTVNFHS